MADTSVVVPEIEKLIAHREWPSISLYLPTPPRETPEQHRIGLKNLLREAERILSAEGLRQSEVAAALAPIEDLLQRSTFWRYQREGVAIFHAPSRTRLHHVPLTLAPLVSVGDRFHVTPLLPLCDRSKTFYILALSLNHVRLLRCAHMDVEEVPFDDRTPRSLSDALGRELTEEHLQWHTAMQRSFGLFHSQGEGEDDRKMDVWRFFERLDDGLRGLIREPSAPIVLAGVDYLTAAFREISELKPLVTASLTGNHDRSAPAELLERAWPLVEPVLTAKAAQDAAVLRTHSDTSLVSRRVEDVLEAALDGRVESVFLRQNAHLWGAFDPQRRTVQLDAGQHARNHDLLDVIATRTFSTGGRVHLVENQPLPPSDGPVTALYRY